ncbi:hypothetical protein CPLU01_00893 [Colletotrichum plurivorum]|uniref:RING-type domain-containing protein n=1 Tax=Colletotrichum plurivorum TaxID=2175906 RepID=A0A8H6NQV4_9PEZI|nr:hypothetical protein CPLU01_00893 [Colletotrichum plurivorum]
MAAASGLGKIQQRYLSTRRHREGGDEGVSWLKKTFLPLVSSWLRPHEAETPEAGRNFFPSPKVTFLVDQPEDLICQICQHSRLIFQDRPEPGSRGRYCDTVPAIMPCGHVAGARCLSKWFRGHDSCPFCRRRLVHGACGHRVATRHITGEGIFLIPTTIPEGGHIPDLCMDCYKKALRKTVNVRFEACKRRFTQARSRFLTSNSAVDAGLLMQRKADLENIMFDEYHIRVAGAWLACW